MQRDTALITHFSLRLRGFSRYLLLLVLCASGFDLAAQQHPTSVRLQLRWHHQFQFAGYYMALQQGYYQQAGLDVSIIAAHAGVSSLEQVLSGKAEFGIAGSGALLAYMQGKPVVAMAAIFQNSPSVWLVLAESDIFSLQDLARSKLEIIDELENAELLAIFAKEGFDLKKLQINTTTMRLDNLLSGKSDAINAYLSNEPYVLDQLGVAYRTINPVSFGVNFYRDVLITERRWLEKHPAVAEAFLAASVAGWKYAFEHVDETIQHIIAHYAPDKTQAQLQFEAQAMRKLVLPDYVSIGHMNPERWQQIAKTFQQLGMLAQVKPLDAFLYTEPQPADYRQLVQFVIVLLAALAVISFITLRFRRLEKALHAEIDRHAQTEQQLMERNQELLQMATTDQLTGLCNRRAILQRAQAEIRRASRYQKNLAVLMLDIDHFKQINDQYGHAVGDKVLIAFATLCLQSIRDTDLAGRYGGEEFFILLPEIDLATAILSADRLRITVSQHPFELSDGSVINVSCSIGIAMFQPEQDDLDKLLLRADQALYQAKRQGRNRCCVQHHSQNDH